MAGGIQLDSMLAITDVSECWFEKIFYGIHRIAFKTSVSNSNQSILFYAFCVPVINTPNWCGLSQGLAMNPASHGELLVEISAWGRVTPASAWTFEVFPVLLNVGKFVKLASNMSPEINTFDISGFIQDIMQFFFGRGLIMYVLELHRDSFDKFASI